ANNWPNSTPPMQASPPHLRQNQRTHHVSDAQTPQHDDQIDLGTPPPRPKQRRFSGTIDQISGSLNFYRVFAFITGIMLLILVAKMIMDYGFGYELYYGG